MDNRHLHYWCVIGPHKRFNNYQAVAFLSCYCCTIVPTEHPASSFVKRSTVVPDTTGFSSFARVIVLSSLKQVRPAGLRFQPVVHLCRGVNREVGLMAVKGCNDQRRVHMRALSWKALSGWYAGIGGSSYVIENKPQEAPKLTVWWSPPWNCGNPCYIAKNKGWLNVVHTSRAEALASIIIDCMEMALAWAIITDKETEATFRHLFAECGHSSPVSAASLSHFSIFQPRHHWNLYHRRRAWHLSRNDAGIVKTAVHHALHESNGRPFAGLNLSISWHRHWLRHHPRKAFSTIVKKKSWTDLNSRQAWDCKINYIKGFERWYA